jgi:hypothetical protein
MTEPAIYINEKGELVSRVSREQVIATLGPILSALEEDERSAVPAAAEPSEVPDWMIDASWDRFGAALQKGAQEDAARYRFLRDADESDPDLPYSVLLTLSGDSLDEAIDHILALRTGDKP